MSNLLEVIELIREEREVLSKQNQKLSDQMYEEKKLISDKYEARLLAFKSDIEHIDDQVRSVGEEMKDAEISADWNEAATRGEINEFYFMSMLKMMGHADLYSELDIKLKQKLPNGLDIWTIIESGRSGWKFYLAFSGTELVGTSHRDTARHAGDETFPYSFIGQLEDALTRMEKNEFNNREWSVNITFMEWMRELKKLKKGDLPVIQMSEETLKSIKKGLSGEWYGHPDEDR